MKTAHGWNDGTSFLKQEQKKMEVLVMLLTAAELLGLAVFVAYVFFFEG